MQDTASHPFIGGIQHQACEVVLDARDQPGCFAILEWILYRFAGILGFLDLKLEKTYT